MAAIKGVKIFQTFENIGRICVGTFEGNKEYIEENVKPLFSNRKVEFVIF